MLEAWENGQRVPVCEHSSRIDSPREQLAARAEKLESTVRVLEAAFRVALDGNSATAVHRRVLVLASLLELAPATYRQLASAAGISSAAVFKLTERMRQELRRELAITGRQRADAPIVAGVRGSAGLTQSHRC